MAIDDGGPAIFRISAGVRPYGGRRLTGARTDGAGLIIGHVAGAKGVRSYRRSEIAPLNVRAVDVAESANRERAMIAARSKGSA